MIILMFVTLPAFDLCSSWAHKASAALHVSQCHESSSSSR
jgi:hypothetical protein